MRERTRRLRWFLALYAGGVAALGLVVLVLRAFTRAAML